MRFDELRPHPDAPQMPNIFLCAISAFIPPLWFKAIAMPRLKHWDLHFANPAERVLAREANRRAGWPDWLAEAK
jgi:alkane 1-monooxygenase